MTLTVIISRIEFKNLTGDVSRPWLQAITAKLVDLVHPYLRPDQASYDELITRFA